MVDGKKALKGLSRTEQFFHIFWLLGPFFMLIERTPGDVYVSIIAVAFAVKSIGKSDTDFLKFFWVKSAFIFWGVCLLSAVLSADPVYSLGEAVVWIRFPLFAMAVMFWLGKDKCLLYLMLLSTGSAVLLMCGILTSEIVAEGFKSRLSWPYDDLVPGNYLAKVGLPLVVSMTAFAMSRNSRLAVFAALITLVCLVFVVLTGERINALILFCSTALIAVFRAQSRRRLFGFFSIGLTVVTVLMSLSPELYDRFLTTFIDQLPTNEHSGYYRAMAPAILAFEQSPFFGVGTANFRNLCPELIVLQPQLGCHPHPHNFYLQMLGETGILGLASGTVFLTSIFWLCFSAGWRCRDNLVLGSLWVVPFALFWPITTSADFFGQWNNIFIWSSVSLALAATNLRQSQKSEVTG